MSLFKKKSRNWKGEGPPQPFVEDKPSAMFLYMFGDLTSFSMGHPDTTKKAEFLMSEVGKHKKEVVEGYEYEVVGLVFRRGEKFTEAK